MFITGLLPQHWPAVKEIYESGIATGNATFQTAAPAWEVWDAAHATTGRLVALVEDRVAGWCALSPVSSRAVYAGVAEVSVYVSEPARGQGIGHALLEALIAVSEQAGYWTLQAGIFPENTASIRLHEQLGFRLVGRREKIGKMHNRWRDTLLFERRSRITGC